LRTFFPVVTEGTRSLRPFATVINDPLKPPYVQEPVFYALVAVYVNSADTAPTVEKVGAGNPCAFIETLSSAVYSTVRNMGSLIPYLAIREVVENLIHADFAEIIVSILDSGNTLRISDQGPGIRDKEKAVLSGFTTATKEMKQYIRGVGCGLPITLDLLSQKGCSLQIDDNLTNGTVITICSDSHRKTIPASHPLDSNSATSKPLESGNESSSNKHLLPKLSMRYKRVLSLAFEFGEIGPTLISKELSVGLSTAYRDLSFLEQKGLLVAKDNGKRSLTNLGITYIQQLFA